MRQSLPSKIKKKTITVPKQDAGIDPILTINKFLENQNKQDLLRFITCGSVDDGKSTLIGRLLWESQNIYDDQLSALRQDSHKHGTQGDDIDFALLVDGLSAEREQGITIDVAYRYFSTKQRRYIVADTPGHEQYTRNMVTGASTADAAVILVDARYGLQAQSKRHAYLVRLMGVRNIVLAVNKMDLIGYSEKSFVDICEAFHEFAHLLDFNPITAIPISALKGDNVTENSVRMPWYSGRPLIEHLENIPLSNVVDDQMIFPIQLVFRPNADFRGYAGTVASGIIKKGDFVKVTRSGQTAKIAEIVSYQQSLERADIGSAITIVLDREIDLSRGDVLTSERLPLESADMFDVTLIWMHEEVGLAGRSYELKLSTQSATVTLTKLKYKINIHHFGHEAVSQLGLNDIAVCTISTAKPLVFQPFDPHHELGRFILIDRLTNATVAAGLIQHAMRRSQNVYKQSHSVSREEREHINGHGGKVIWFTGLSGSGKSMLANALDREFYRNGVKSYILDGDNIRMGINKDLGFSDADRVENIRRAAEIAKLFMDAGLIVLVAFISPFKRDREMARDLVGADNFLEVFVNTPLELCEKRDSKGLYAKARRGEIPNFSGISSLYEPPILADLEVIGSEEEQVKNIEKIFNKLDIGRNIRK